MGPIQVKAHSRSLCMQKNLFCGRFFAALVICRAYRRDTQPFPSLPLSMRFVDLFSLRPCAQHHDDFLLCSDAVAICRRQATSARALGFAMIFYASYALSRPLFVCFSVSNSHLDIYTALTISHSLRSNAFSTPKTLRNVFSV